MRSRIFGRLVVALAAGVVLGLAAPVTADEGSGIDYAPSSSGTRLLEKGDIDIRMLLEASNLGGQEIEIGEITLPLSYGQGGDHHHAKMEIFYVLSGRLGHTVNGEPHVLEPGMVGVVRVGDSIAHAVLSDKPVKALVIWLPGGEADRLVANSATRNRLASNPRQSAATIKSIRAESLPEVWFGSEPAVGQNRSTGPLPRT